MQWSSCRRRQRRAAQALRFWWPQLYSDPVFMGCMQTAPVRGGAGAAAVTCQTLIAGDVRPQIPLLAGPDQGGCLQYYLCCPQL